MTLLIQQIKQVAHFLGESVFQKIGQGSVLNWPDFCDNIVALQSCYFHRHSLPFPRQWTGPLTFHLKCFLKCVGVLCVLATTNLHTVHVSSSICVKCPPVFWTHFGNMHWFKTLESLQNMQCMCISGTLRKKKNPFINRSQQILYCLRAWERKMQWHCGCLPAPDTWIQATVLTAVIFRTFNQVSKSVMSTYLFMCVCTASSSCALSR